MWILGIGVDVVHLPRIAALIKRRTAHKLASRILSTHELEDWQRVVSQADLAQQTRFLAVRFVHGFSISTIKGRNLLRCSCHRWSVKEAAYKALYPHVVPTWKEITYTGFDAKNRTKPTLEYWPFRPTQTEIGKIHCSVSHDGEYVFTSVLVEEHCTNPSP